MGNEGLQKRRDYQRSEAEPSTVAQDRQLLAATLGHSKIRGIRPQAALLNVARAVLLVRRPHGADTGDLPDHCELVEERAELNSVVNNLLKMIPMKNPSVHPSRASESLF